MENFPLLTAGENTAARKSLVYRALLARSNKISLPFADGGFDHPEIGY
jgi:hypothetical protein